MDHLYPRDAYAFLQANPEALLVDCRCETEFLYVGHPVGAEHIAWQEGADWEFNPKFVDQVTRLAGGRRDRSLLLICRSGQRSLEAGLALEAAGFTRIINIAEGFEGALDDDFHRGTLGGWRFHGLPWQQT